MCSTASEGMYGFAGLLLCGFPVLGRIGGSMPSRQRGGMNEMRVGAKILLGVALGLQSHYWCVCCLWCDFGNILVAAYCAAGAVRSPEYGSVGCIAEGGRTWTRTRPCRTEEQSYTSSCGTGLFGLHISSPRCDPCRHQETTLDNSR